MVMFSEAGEKQSVIDSSLHTMKLTLIQKIKLKINGRVYLEHRTKHGWRGSLPFYAFRCPIHGIVIDYPHGVDDSLSCTKCWEEKFLNKETVK